MAPLRHLSAAGPSPWVRACSKVRGQAEMGPVEVAMVARQEEAGAALEDSEVVPLGGRGPAAVGRQAGPQDPPEGLPDPEETIRTGTRGG